MLATKITLAAEDHSQERHSSQISRASGQRLQGRFALVLLELLGLHQKAVHKWLGSAEAGINEHKLRGTFCTRAHC